MRHFLLAFAAACLGLAGCDRMTYEVGLTMPPHSVADATAIGPDAWATIENRGPGVVEATFDVDDPETERTLEIVSGTASGRALHGTRRIRLRTRDEESQVTLRVQHASGLEVHEARSESRDDSGRGK